MSRKVGTFYQCDLCLTEFFSEGFDDPPEGWTVFRSLNRTGIKRDPFHLVRRDICGRCSGLPLSKVVVAQLGIKVVR